MSIGLGLGVSLGTRRGVALGGGGWVPVYLLYDTYTSDLTAGAINGTSAEPGPGIRALVDTGSRVTQKYGDLLMATGGGATDPVIHYGPFTPAPGLCLVVHFRQDSTLSAGVVASLGFDNNNTTYIEANRLRFINTGGVIQMANAGYFGSYTNVGTYEAMTLYTLALVYLDTKVVYLIRGGSYTDWTVLGSQTKHAATSVYAAVNAYNRNTAVKAIAVATLPEPWTTDAIADGLTDGARYYLNQVAPLTLLTTNHVAQMFAPSSSGSVGVERSGNSYWLWQDIGGGRRWYVKLAARTSPSVIHALAEAEIRLNGSVVATLNSSSGSVWEYAYIDNGDFVGNAHGYDTQTGLTIVVDGAPVTLSDGQSATGSAVVITRTSDVTKADGVTPLGEATVVYTMSPSSGLTVDVDLDWSVSGSFPVTMMPYDDLCDVGYLVYPSGKYYDMTAYIDTDINYDSLTTNCALAFDRDGNAAICAITDVARTMHQQDRGSLNKIYSYTTSADFSANYRAMWFSGTGVLLV